GGSGSSSVEIPRRFLGGVLDAGLFWRPALAPWIETAALAVGGLLIVFLVPRLRARHAMLLLLLLIAGFVAVGTTLYLRRSILFDAATPSLALGVLFTVLLTVTLSDAGTQRRA